MGVIWVLPNPVSVAGVREALPPQERVAYNTLKTTMERLAGKGILTRTKRGKAYLYSAAVTQQELERRIVSAAMDRLVRQFPQAVASFFVQPETTLSEERLALLQDAIQRQREKDDA